MNTNSLSFFAHFITQRLQYHFGLLPTGEALNYFSLTGSDFLKDFTRITPHSTNEQIVLLLALAPHAEPYFLNKIIAEVLPQGGNFPEIGGIKDANNRYIYPTGETAIFILAG